MRAVEAMRSVLGEQTSVSGWDKFTQEYGPPDDSDSEADSDVAGARKGRKAPAAKPDDWEALFKQNVDDDFKVLAPFLYP